MLFGTFVVLLHARDRFRACANCLEALQPSGDRDRSNDATAHGRDQGRRPPGHVGEEHEHHARDQVDEPGEDDVAVAGAPIKAGDAALPITVGLISQAGAISNATNAYSLILNTQTGETNNYAAIFQDGNVGIGTTAPTATLHVVSAAPAAAGAKNDACRLRRTTERDVVRD